jgi:hypothetical protein
MDTNKKPINHQISHDFHKITKKYLTAESAEIAENKTTEDTEYTENQQQR